MKKQTIIALITPREEETVYNISDNDFLSRAITEEHIYSFEEFENLWNSDEIKVKDFFIRVLEVSSTLKLSLG